MHHGLRTLIDKKNIHDKISILLAMNQEQMHLQYQLSDIVIMIPGSDGTPNSAIKEIYKSVFNGN